MNSMKVFLKKRHKSTFVKLEENTKKKIKKNSKKVLTFYLHRGNINIVVRATKKHHEFDEKSTQKNILKKFKKSVDNKSKRC